MNEEVQLRAKLRDKFRKQYKYQNKLCNILKFGCKIELFTRNHILNFQNLIKVNM